MSSPISLFPLISSLLLSLVLPLSGQTDDDIEAEIYPKKGHTGTIFSLSLTYSDEWILEKQTPLSFENFTLLETKEEKTTETNRIKQTWELMPLAAGATLPSSLSFYNLKTESYHLLSLPQIEVVSAWEGERQSSSPQFLSTIALSKKPSSPIKIGIFLLMLGALTYLGSQRWKRARERMQRREMRFSQSWGQQLEKLCREGSWSERYLKVYRFFLSKIGQTYQLPSVQSCSSQELLAVLDARERGENWQERQITQLAKEIIEKSRLSLYGKEEIDEDIYQSFYSDVDFYFKNASKNI